MQELLSIQDLETFKITKNQKTMWACYISTDFLGYIRLICFNEVKWDKGWRECKGSTTSHTSHNWRKFRGVKPRVDARYMHRATHRARLENLSSVLMHDVHKIVYVAYRNRKYWKFSRLYRKNLPHLKNTVWRSEIG